MCQTTGSKTTKVSYWSHHGGCFPSTQQGGGGGGGHSGRQTERQRMLTHLRPSGLIGGGTADTEACRMWAAV